MDAYTGVVSAGTQRAQQAETVEPEEGVGMLLVNLIKVAPASTCTYLVPLGQQCLQQFVLPLLPEQHTFLVWDSMAKRLQHNLFDALYAWE